jgi:hypothetical protein
MLQQCVRVREVVVQAPLSLEHYLVVGQGEPFVSYVCQALFGISNGSTFTAPTHSAFSLFVNVRHSLRVSSSLHRGSCDSSLLVAVEKWELRKTAIM